MSRWYNGESFGILHYKTIEEKIVAHLYFIINDHAFTDGNKRTAVLVFQILCRINNLYQRLGDYNLDALAVFLEYLEEKDHHLIIRVVAEKIFDQP
ncbi:MAG: Fic family protein [Candidatus Paceibacterota bacterium]